MQLESMYQDIILDHYRHPHHKGLRDPFDAEVHHVNPVCGDEVTLRVSLKDALARVPKGMPVVVEVETDAQLAEALAAGVTHILADNQPPAVIAQWVRRAGPAVTIQASGGITAETAAAYARAGAQLISVGALTHSAPAAAIGFELVA